MTELVKGAQYRVVKSGAYLQWWESRGPNCQQSVSLKLEVNDVITYGHNAYGGMSDDVNYDYFRKGAACGEFWPNNWGAGNMSFLEPVATTVGAT